MLRVSSACSCAVASLLITAQAVLAQTTMTPLSTFGTGGWLAPGSSTFLTTGNTERGLAYNPATGHLVLVSRSGGNNLRVLDGSTGADLGGLDATGISGGTFAVNMADVAADGSIYACNLTINTTTNFKVYKWTSEAFGVPPTVAYDALSGMVRTGDSFAVTGGSGGNPVIFAAAGSSNANNSCFAVGPVDGSNASTAYLSVPGTPSGTSNGYRLGMTFVDQDTIIGTQGLDGFMTSFGGATATLDAAIPLGGAPRRAMDYAVIGGTPILAVIDSNSSMVYVLDITVPTAPTLLASATATSGTLSANTNGTGSVQWGAISGNTARLYAMNSNQGIQAFDVSIQLPASAQPYGTGCGAPPLTLSASAAPVLGTTVNLDLNNIPATAVLAVYVLGFVGIPNGVPVPIAPGCNQYLSLDATFVVLTGGASSTSFAQNFPNFPNLVGFEIFAQGVSFDAVSSTILASNGLRLYLETF